MEDSVMDEFREGSRARNSSRTVALRIEGLKSVNELKKGCVLKKKYLFPHKVMPKGQYYTCSRARKQLEQINMDAQQPSVNGVAEELKEEVEMPQAKPITEQWDDSYVTSFE
uniref:Uncharacterized protein n=2 Tax=Timema TaxID=61471 RepID=A0A7R9NYY9_9NEOP|nr:unnamed protein product [Timema bartmani]CAD7461273.1 unnamed protein product [Timema tahoe]